MRAGSRAEHPAELRQPACRLSTRGAALELAPALAQARSLVALLRTVFVAFDEPMPKAFELAEREARQALNADPSLPLGHQALANVLAARGAWREAEAHYDAACRFEKEPDARVTRIWQLVQSVGHLRRSLRLAAEIDTLAPSQPLGAVAAAQACCLLGLDRDASEHADTAASLGWPLHHPVACDLRAQLELRSGRFHEAAEWMTRGMGTRWRAAGGAQVIGAVPALERVARRPAAVRGLLTFSGRFPAGHSARSRQPSHRAVAGDARRPRRSVRISRPVARSILVVRHGGHRLGLAVDA